MTTHWRKIFSWEEFDAVEADPLSAKSVPKEWGYYTAYLTYPEEGIEEIDIYAKNLESARLFAQAFAQENYEPGYTKLVVKPRGPGFLIGSQSNLKLSWEEVIEDSYLVGKFEVKVDGDRLGNMPSNEEEVQIEYDPTTKVYDAYLDMADEHFKAFSIEELRTNIINFLKIGWQRVRVHFVRVKRTPRSVSLSSLKLSSLDENTDLSEAKAAEYLEIQITSTKDYYSKGEKSGFYPTSTTAKYRFSNGGKWEYIGDYDSGEQQGIATDIPEGLKKVLLAFGLTERLKKASLVLGRAKHKDEVTETYTFSASKEVMERFKRFLAFFAHNGGHSGTFGMSFDGDGADYMYIEPKIPKYEGMDEVAGKDVELASNDGYYGLKIERDEEGRQKESSLKLSWEDDKPIYNSKGFVYGFTFGGGKGAYTAEPLSGFASKEALIKEANKKLEDGTLDAGMGFESLLGAILYVTENVGPYYHRPLEPIFIGKLTNQEKRFLSTLFPENVM